MAGVAFELVGAKLQLATITVPLAPGALQDRHGLPSGSHEPDLLPAPLPPSFAALAVALLAVRAATTPDLPFAVHVAGADTLCVVCQRSKVAGVFKLLRAQQAALGIAVKDVKSHVALTPLAGDALGAACAAALAASLSNCGWWQMDEQRLLGASPLQPSADGQPVSAASIQLRVHVAPAAGPKDASRLLLLALAEQVEWRHPACRASTSLGERSAQLAGSLCTLLPDMRPAIIQRLRPADAAALGRLRPLWAVHGQPLPADVEQQPLVEVTLDCDPDAPSFLIPACRVLGQHGVHSAAATRSSPAVQAVLAKLRDDLASSPLKPLGEGLRLGPTAHEWHPDGPPTLRGRELAAAAASEKAAQPVFMTARQHEEQGKDQQSTAGPALGQPIQVASFGPAGAGAAAGQQRRRHRQHTPLDPKLRAAFEEAKRLQVEAERPAGGTAHRSGTAHAAAPPQPSAGKPVLLALRLAAAAAAAGGVQRPAIPTFKRVVVSTAAAVAAPKKTTGVQKRTAPAAKAGVKPVAKRPKAATGGTAAASASAAPTPAGSAAAPGSAGPEGMPILAEATPASAAKPAAWSKLVSRAGGTAGLGTVAPGSVAGNGAGPAIPKAPGKPRAKPAEIDVAAVTAKVQQMHAAGTLSKMTIPELKAYLKSIKQPVGGKKGELEERVRQSLGGWVAVPSVAAA